MAKFTIEFSGDVVIDKAVSDNRGFSFNSYGDFEAEVVFDVSYGVSQFDFELLCNGNIENISPSPDELEADHGFWCRIEGNRLEFGADYNPDGFEGVIKIVLSGGEVAPPEPEYKKIKINNWIGVMQSGDYDPDTGYNAVTPDGEFLDFNGVIAKYPDGELVEVEGNYLNYNIHDLIDGKNAVDLYPKEGFAINRVGLRIAYKNGNGHWVDNPPSVGSWKPSEIVIEDGFFRLFINPNIAEILVVVDGDGSEGGAGVAGGAYAHNYLLTKKEYSQLSGESFSIIRNNGVELEVLKFDQWIDNVRLYPFPVSTEDIGHPEKIIAGTLTLETTAKSLRSDVIRLDFGDIEVKGRYDNSLDLRGVECRLFIPFIEGYIGVNIEEIINKKLNILCYVVVSDGVTTVNLYSDGELINTTTTTIGRSIPLMMVEKAQSTSLTINGAINSLKQAFIRVERPIYSGMVLTPEDVELVDYSGYFKLKQGDIVIGNTMQESEMLENILKNGVFKND